MNAVPSIAFAAPKSKPAFGYAATLHALSREQLDQNDLDDLQEQAEQALVRSNRAAKTMRSYEAW
jgi:hypothetical protein